MERCQGSQHLTARHSPGLPGWPAPPATTAAATGAAPATAAHPGRAAGAVAAAVLLQPSGCCGSRASAVAQPQAPALTPQRLNQQQLRSCCSQAALHPRRPLLPAAAELWLPEELQERASSPAAASWRAGGAPAALAAPPLAQCGAGSAPPPAPPPARRGAGPCSGTAAGMADGCVAAAGLQREDERTHTAQGAPGRRRSRGQARSVRALHPRNHVVQHAQHGSGIAAAAASAGRLLG